MQKDVNEIIEKYSDMVYRIAITRCGTVENAEDVFQDVFMKYSENNPKFENSEHEKAWFIRVTINLTKNLKTSSWNKKVITLDESIVFEKKEESDVFSIVCELPQNYRTVIYLGNQNYQEKNTLLVGSSVNYEGYKVKEISDLMKKSEGTIKTWLFRAREILKEKLEGGFENE